MGAGGRAELVGAVVRRADPGRPGAAGGGAGLPDRERGEVHGPGDRIALVGCRDAAGWTVEVVDSGAGIPPESVPNLLTGGPGHGTPTGTGLGLAIVRAVAGSLGGRVTVGATPGGGARVGLRVPEPTPVGGSAPPRPEPVRAQPFDDPLRLPDPAH
ncbi:ATP-binding protein [Micromonospora sp. ATA51]|uniref:ATP-binding protein n=1 Tax=Micromonospora sp. ATA51 TaxID=2806098 RepID=UPI0035C9485E